MLNSSTVSALTHDTFFVTTNQGGDKTYLWYFERNGRKIQSKLYFVALATTGGPKL